MISYFLFFITSVKRKKYSKVSNFTKKIKLNKIDDKAHLF